MEYSAAKEGETATTATEIAGDVYRVLTYAPDFGVQFNQFLVKDDEPFLMHTGFKKMFATTRDAVATALAPAGHTRHVGRVLSSGQLSVGVLVLLSVRLRRSDSTAVRHSASQARPSAAAASTSLR